MLHRPLKLVEKGQTDRQTPGFVDEELQYKRPVAPRTSTRTAGHLFVSCALLLGRAKRLHPLHGRGGEEDYILHVFDRTVRM